MRKVVLIGLLVVAAVAGGAVYANRDEIWPIEDQIEIAAQLDGARCTDPGYDVLVAVRNRSNKTVMRVEARIEAQRRGYSNIIAGDKFESDKIMPPLALEEYCIVRPRSPFAGTAVSETSYFPDPYLNVADDDLVLSSEITYVYAE